MAATPSGKDKILRYTRIFVGGYDLSGDARTFDSLENGYGEVEFTGWSETVKNFLADGRRMVGVRGFQALLNDAAARAWTILKDAENSSRVTMLFGGGGEPDVPDPAYIIGSIQMMDTSSFDGGAAVMSADFLPETSQLDSNTDKPWGVCLAGATSLSASTNGTSHDAEAATTNGWHANLHILASSGGTWAFRIEHSSNDSSWSTLGTFAGNGSAITSEHLTGSGSVNRYVRMVATRTSGTVTAVIAFARN